MSKLLYTNLSAMTVTASSENAEYPTTNLLDYNDNTRWIADAVGTNLYCMFDLGAITACNTVIISYHNIDVVGCTSILFQSADDAAFTSNVETLVQLDSVIDIDTANVMYKTFSTKSKRYFRVYYNGVSKVVPYLGNVYIGTPLTLRHEYQFGYKKDNSSYATSETTSLRGTVKTSQPYEGRLMYELQYRWLNESERQDFIDFVASVQGRLYPWYFIDHESNVEYVRFAEDYTPTMVMRANITDLQTIKMKGAAVGISEQTTMFGILDDELIETVA